MSASPVGSRSRGEVARSHLTSGPTAPSPAAPGRAPLIAQPEARPDADTQTWNPPREPSRLRKAFRATTWLPAFAWQRVVRRSIRSRPAHVMVAVADHFEAAYVPRLLQLPTSEAEQQARVDRWCERFRDTADSRRDTDGHPFTHTYFLPAEDSYPAVVERLADLCRAGFGEIEIQLHHGVWEPDTGARTRATIESFRDQLVAHGCLSRWNGAGPPLFGFVHGNWALANSHGGSYCGVDDEMQILADIGCYADFTLPSAPSVAQISKINSIYECTLPLDQAAPHRSGRDLHVGTPPERWPLIVQGPLGLYLPREQRRPTLWPRIENGEISQQYPPTPKRVANWRDAAITVIGRPDWVFVKLHCHGLGEVDFESLIGRERRALLDGLAAEAAARGDTLHFVSARELVNVALAACDGREGNPNDYRDYRLQPITPRA